MKKILIKVAGGQKLDNQVDKMELTTVGTIEESDSTYIIRYNEEQEPPMAPLKATVTVKKDNSVVEITRSGANSSVLTVEGAKRHLCNYGTQYGDILMGISGHSIETDINDDGGKISFRYDIDINGALVSLNEVEITYKNQE